MTGGLIQLLGKGSAEDVYFASSPDLGIWRGTFKKVSNYAVEAMRLRFQATPRPGQKCTCVLDKHGDMLMSLVVEVTMTKTEGDFTAAYHPVEALLEEVALVVDGQVVDRHTSDWLRLYNTLHQPYDKAQQYARLTNFDPATISSGTPATQTFMFPLVFSFCRHPGAALPLVAMQFSEVTLQIQLADAARVGISEEGFEMAVYGHYVYLDAAERASLLRGPYDCLIEQVQRQTFTLPTGVPNAGSMSQYQARLSLYHPVKCLYWFVREEFGGHGRYVGGASTVPLAYTADVSTPSGLCLVSPVSDNLSPIYESQLKFNEQDRTQAMKGVYFNRVLPYMHCAGHPVPGVCVFPFSVRPEQLTPSGWCNFSNLSLARVDVQLKRSAAPGEAPGPTAAQDIAGMRTLEVLAWGYNVLRFEAGRAVVAFP